MKLFNKQCHTKTLTGVKNEVQIFVMYGRGHVANFIAHKGRVYNNYDLIPPWYVDQESWLEKRQEAWDYIHDVASIQAQNIEVNEGDNERFEINIDDFFNEGE